MTSKHCGHHDDDDDKRGPLRFIAAAILSLIALVLFIVLLVWLILRPTKPRFILQDATIFTFNTTQPNILSTTFQITLSTHNPNGRIGIFYDRLDVFAAYHNQQITLPTRLPPSYQGHHDTTVWSPFLYGQSVPVAPFLGLSLQQDLDAGLVFMNIRIDGRVRWKVGTWISGKYHLNGNCPAYITFGKRGHNTGVGFVGAAIKFQLASSCAIDV